MRWIVRTVGRVADVCRAQARLVRAGAGAGGGTRAVVSAAAARSGLRPATGADVAPAGRRRSAGDAAPPAGAAPAGASPVMAGWFDWIGGLGATEVAAGGGGHLADGTLWLAVIAGLGALALAGLAARSHIFARDRRPPILHGTRAARGEVGQAVPLLLLILLLGILAAELVLAILTL